jgi:hypothetical protein
MARGAPVTDAAPLDVAGPPARTSEVRTASDSPLRRRRGDVHLGAIAVLLVGLVITATLSIGSQALHDNNEQRLLRQRVREVAAVLTASIPTLQAPLAVAAAVATTTNGSPASFRTLMLPFVTANGSTPARFVSASLWSVSTDSTTRIATVGGTPVLARETPAAIRRALRAPSTPTSFVVNDLLRSDRRLGYSYGAPGAGPRYEVYVESALPEGRRSRADSNSAFADLDYALFVGTQPDPVRLIASSTGGSLLHGRRANDTVALGDDQLLLVIKARDDLGGTVLARLPWALALGGLVLTLAGAFLVERLMRRRDHAEALALENDELYREQRAVTITLQHGLLPDTLPDVAGLDLAARYVAGAEGIDIGGDWYDVLARDDGQVVFVVGDVSGHGLRAATAMAELRYAFRAYAAQGDAPEAMLAKVSKLISVGRDGHFATAVCGVVDVGGHRMSLANAGHPDPLLVAGGDAHFVGSPIGAPLGVESGSSYSAVSVVIPMGATVLAYTDGLVERRGEHLDTGRERLRRGSLEGDGPLDDQLSHILDVAIPSGSPDDTALLGLRWLS